MSVTILKIVRESLTVSVRGTKVVLLSEGELIAEMPWDKAEELGKVLARQARKAEANHWLEIDPYFTGGVKVKRVCGLPVLTSKEQMENLGNGLKKIT